VGVLESWRDGVLAVRKRDGTLVEIAEDTLVAAKIVRDPLKIVRET
jgi:hypothetical protein